MSERTILAVVSDLIKTGLTVEQQVLVNELALFGAMAASSRIYERERKRAYRENVPDVPDKRKEPKENNILNITHLEGVQGKPLSRTLSPEGVLFQAFWEVFPRKVAKGAAAKAFRNALSRSPAEPIIAGASRYAASKPDPQFTKHPATWLNADCWLDEPDKPKNNVHAGPWKPVEPEPDRPKISDEERQANLEKLAKIRFKPKGI